MTAKSRRKNPDPEKEEFMRAVGAVLKRQRLSLGLTQNAVAKALGLNGSTLRNAEPGRQWLPITTLRPIVGLYGYTLSRFFYRVERYQEQKLTRKS